MKSEPVRKDVWILDARVQADAAARYRTACANIFEVTTLCPDEEFSNRLEGYNLDGLVFLHCQGVAQRYRRERAHIAADPGDLIQVVLELEGDGWAGDYEGRAADRSMGSIRIMDMSRPFDMTTGAFRTLHFIVPRDRLGESGALDLHGLVVSETTPTGRMLGSHLRHIAELVDQLTQAEAVGVAGAAAGLTAAAIIAHSPARLNKVRTLNRTLMATARAYVDKRLEDPELKPEDVRAHLNVSRSHLYQAFESVGGVSTFIQSRRLDRAFDVILGDREQRLTLGAIAYGHGFRSDAHFNRVFRSRFGVPPGRLRDLGDKADIALSMADRPDDVWSWLKSL